MSYNYNPKVMNPNAVLPQTTSNALQVPFYFGGSQIPLALGIEGSGFKTPYYSHVKQMKELSAQGRGLETTVNKNHKIYLPKHIKTI